MLESIIDIVRRAGELVRSAHSVTAATHEKNGPAAICGRRSWAATAPMC